MVAALIMGAAIEPRPVFVKINHVIPGWCVSTGPGISILSREIPGSRFARPGMTN
jgi:hypothetical protein